MLKKINSRYKTALGDKQRYSRKAERKMLKIHCSIPIQKVAEISWAKYIAIMGKCTDNQRSQ